MDAIVTETTIDSGLLEAIEALSKEGAAWGPGVTINQNMVDFFLSVTGDINPIHRADALPKPIVPGLLTLALLPKLSPLSKQSEIGGCTVINKGFRDIDFSRPVPVGSTIQLRYGHDRPWADRIGVYAPFTFEIALAPAMKTVATGTIVLLLVRPRKT